MGQAAASACSVKAQRSASRCGFLTSALLRDKLTSHMVTQEQGSASGQAAASASGAQAQVEAAAASEYLEALEQLLPESASALLQSVGKHAAAGREHAFTCRQLLAIACACLDLTDASSRNAASDLVQVQ